MDDKWRTVKCLDCNGHGMYLNAGGEPSECITCDMSGVNWIRPSGHMFRWPGGPALGKASAEEYEQATSADD